MSILIPLSLNSEVSVLADWMELQAFSSPNKLATESDIIAISHIDDELDEENDPIETDARAEELTDEIFSELGRRLDAAGKQYPFTINPGGTILTLTNDRSDGQYAYLFCLLVSEWRRLQIVPKQVFSPIAEFVEDLFQICSTIAAAGLLNGCAVSFGFPRPDKSGFLAALKRTFEEGMREGQIVPKAPPGVESRTKDGGIDIIAWRHFPDELPGKLHLFGQCASGRNYKEKSVQSFIKSFREDWFVRPPGSQVLEAIFIPFMLEEGYKRLKLESRTEARHGHYLSLARTMGIIVDRCRMAYLVETGMEIANAQPSWVQCAPEMKRVRDWVHSAETALCPT
jgi:hypothetical protein